MTSGGVFKAGLPALRKAAEMTGHAALFKADRLPAVGAGFSQKAVLVFVAPHFLVLEVSPLEDLADGVRDG